MSLFSRIAFAFRHRTLRGRAAVDKVLLVHHAGETVRVPLRCPHQGGPMEAAPLDGDCLVCPWHGCRISLTGKAPVMMKGD